MSSLPWAELPDSKLLKIRICDLNLELKDSAVAERVTELHAELKLAGLRFRPYVWLSTDWFTPDSATGFAVPFYLAHPRLIRLERRQMLQIEGGTRAECMKLMRHEAAHALDNAYRLRRRKRWRETFGRSSESYASTYTPDPTSRHHVLNLDYWYSQSHPLEDWAETVAVWLQPGSRWRDRYAGWPALKKIEYVDELLREVAKRPPLLRTRARVEPLATVKLTLGEYYQRKRLVYSDEGSPALDGQLSRIFVSAEVSPRRAKAAAFLRKHRNELVRRVSGATGQHRYLLDHVVREMVERCRTKKLVLSGTSADALLGSAIVLTSLSSQFLYGAHPNYHR
ncbi:MAG: hypothetical protein ACI9F9_002945 [Candidatus Paceibacteria bacterium]|jgi:hypothetical protein